MMLPRLNTRQLGSDLELMSSLYQTKNKDLDMSFIFFTSLI